MKSVRRRLSLFSTLLSESESFRGKFYFLFIVACCRVKVYEWTIFTPQFKSQVHVNTIPPSEHKSVQQSESDACRRQRKPLGDERMGMWTWSEYGQVFEKKSITINNIELDWNWCGSSAASVIYQNRPTVLHETTRQAMYQVPSNCSSDPPIHHNSLAVVG